MAILTVAYSSKVVGNEVVINNSQGDSIQSNSPKDLLNFMARNYTDALNRKMCWSLDAFIAPCLKVIGLKVCQELVKEPDCEALWSYDGNEVKIHDIKDKSKILPAGFYSLYYHRGTSLGLQVGGERKSYFYNLVQFFETDEDIADCQQILGKAKELVDAFFSMGLNPLKLSSPISVYQSNVLEHIDFPTLADLPNSLSEKDCNDLAEWSEQIMHREWTTALAVGMWKEGESFSYDISSAYGFEFSELKNFKYAKFTRSFLPEKEADWGIMKGKITINAGVKCSPICYKKENGQTINPMDSTWEDVITLPEVRWIYRHKIGSFEMEDGIFWKYTAPVQPFKVHMQRIFGQRSKGGLVKKLAKRIGASAWAKCIQKSNSVDGNKYYSPILALQVKTNCRLTVANFIYSNNLQSDILHIGTDGVRAGEHISIPENINMGSWKENPSDSCIILSPGVIYTPEHKPGGLYLDDILKMVWEHPNETYYATKKTRHLTLGEAVEMGELDKVGELREFSTSIDLIDARLRQDMDFPDFPTSGKDLIEHKYYGEAVKV